MVDVTFATFLIFVLCKFVMLFFLWRAALLILLISFMFDACYRIFEFVFDESRQALLDEYTLNWSDLEEFMCLKINLSFDMIVVYVCFLFNEICVS